MMILQLIAISKHKNPIFRGESRYNKMVLVLIPRREAIRLSLVFPMASKQLERGACKYSIIQIGASNLM